MWSERDHQNQLDDLNVNYKNIIQGETKGQKSITELVLGQRFV